MKNKLDILGLVSFIGLYLWCSYLVVFNGG